MKGKRQREQYTSGDVELKREKLKKQKNKYGER